MIESAAFKVDEADVSVLQNVVFRLASIGYNEKEVCKHLGVKDITEITWRAQPIYREERLGKRDLLDLAIDLFLLQGTLTRLEIDKLFSKHEQDILISTGLIFEDESNVAARASIFLVGDKLIFSDHAWPKLPHPGCIDVPDDQVMFIGTDSRWLAHATIRRPVKSALDLCTGSGIHAILAAGHSERVVAVDISPRAAKCTSFNARVSGAANIEVKVGDLYEPVGDEQFDLITANPPFVPSPVSSIKFRDGGNSGEEVQRRIIAGLPHHLKPGGIAQIVTEFGEGSVSTIAERLREWLDGAPMDILILRLREHSAASYAIGHADGDDTYGEFLDSVRDWYDNLKEQGYTGVASVLLAFKWSDKAAEEPWTRIEVIQPPDRGAGAEVEEMFSAENFIRQEGLCEKISKGRLRLTGPIGIMEAGVLGGNMRANTQAKLLGKSLKVVRWLEPTELEVLALMEKPISLHEIFVMTREKTYRMKLFLI